MKEIIEFLKWRRKVNKITQEELAVGIGVTRERVATVETKFEAPLSFLQKYADYLGYEVIISLKSK